MKEYLLTNGDIEQIIARYKNAKAESKRLQRIGNPECRFEAGRAYALEGILRMIDIDDYTDMATGKFYDEE